MPAYVFADDAFMQDLIDENAVPVPPSIVIANIGNGDVDVSFMENALDLAFDRYAGHIDITDDYLTGEYPNPWDAKPSYLNEAIEYADSKGP